MKKFLLLTGAIAAFIIGYGASASFAAYPSGGIHGRGEHNGYFTNVNDDMGSPVLSKVYEGNSQAINPNVVDATTFINFIKYTKLDIDDNGSGNTRDKTGAAFIIHTMIGSSTSARSRPPTAAQINEWEQRVRYLDMNGKVNWNVNYTYTINSYWQATDGGGSNPNDDAFYDENGTSPAIVFRNMSNAVVYAIRIECANPVGTGSLGPLPNNPDFNMWGGTTININGGPTVYSGDVAPGDQVVFHHYLENVGADGTTPNTIAWRIYSGATQLFTGNAGTFTGAGTAGDRKDNVQVETYTVPAGAAPGSQICRNIWYTPDTEVGGSQEGTERCLTVKYDYDLEPIITMTVNGAAPSGGTAEAGDTIAFTYIVNNNGSTNSENVSCDIYQIIENGSYSVPNPIDSATRPGPYTKPILGCPRAFPPNASRTLNTDTFANVAANKTYCMSFFINPSTFGGGRVGTESCIRIVAKPYLKVYGGDVLAGSGLETAPNTCASNTDAQIVSWNKRLGGSYAGAGTQYAAMALNRIYDFASAQQAGSSAAAPTALSFANTGTNTTNGIFGTSFGSAPCIKDYWAAMPAGLPAPGQTDVGRLATGMYYSNTGTTISGTNGSFFAGTPQRIVLYVNGNLQINGNIRYPGNWSADTPPLFQVIVRGNIYIAPGVTELSGNFVAQGNGSTTGVIYTCAPAGTSQPTLGTTLYSDCDTKLTINGTFTANRVELLRTSGSLTQGIAGETAGSPGVAEEFIYSAANWMGQPPRTQEGDDYDAITSLPPIL
jgi:hypothetical protein